jgi:hypothetical protein
MATDHIGVMRNWRYTRLFDKTPTHYYYCATGQVVTSTTQLHLLLKCTPNTPL